MNGELPDRGDDDLLAALDEPAQIHLALGGPDRALTCAYLPDRVPDLTVEDDLVGDHDDRVEDRSVVPRQLDQLIASQATVKRFCSNRSGACALWAEGVP